MASSTTPAPHGRRRNAERFGRNLSAGGRVHRVVRPERNSRAWRFAVRRSCPFEASQEPLTDLKPPRAAGSSEVSGSSFRLLRVRGEIGLSAFPAWRVSAPVIVGGFVDKGFLHAHRRRRVRRDRRRREHGTRRELGDPGGAETVGSAVRNALRTFRFFVGVAEFPQRSMEFRRISSSSGLTLRAGGYRTRAIRCGTGIRPG